MRRRVRALLVVACVAAATLAAADEAFDDRRWAELFEASERLLGRPETDSDPNLPLEVHRTASQGILVGGTLTLPVLDEPFYESLRYEYEVNLITNRYRTRLVSHQFSRATARAVTKPAPMAPPPQHFLCTANATVSEKDAPGFLLATTYNSLNWQRITGQPACADYSFGRCTPVCPTAPGTCWMTGQPCFHAAVSYGQRPPFSASTTGYYVNWDFADPNQRTDVSHYNLTR